MKRVGKDEHLLTENEVIVNDKKNNTEVIDNILIQKPNSQLGIGKLSFPLRLHIYNLARPNIDSILNEKIYNDPKKAAWKTKLLSKKQLVKDIESRKKLNSWLKKTGEAPVIVNEEKTKKSSEQLKKYFIKNGWLNASTSYEITRNENQRASIEYNITTGQPFLLDSISEKISSPVIDSLYRDLRTKSLLKIGDQYNESNYTNERDRLTVELRNSGLFHFGQDYITFEIDTIGTNKKINTKLLIKDRILRNEDSIVRTPFKVYKIKDVNIFTDYKFENRNSIITDTVQHNNFNLYSFDELKYRPKALTDAIFITKGQVFRDIDRTRTYRYISELRTFKYPNIEYIENANDTTLTANIYLTPRKKYDLGFDFDISQSNIQTLGFSFSSGLIIRNIFRGAETFEVSALGSIGASKDASDANDQFFDINEIGANLKLTIPRLFLPFNTEKIIPKYMSPSSRIIAGATSQKNIGLDKQSFTGSLNYNWRPSSKFTNNLDLFNVQFVKNLNTDNYFGVYQNSYDRLNDIAREISYISPDESLGIPNEADTFISDVLDQNTILIPEDQNYVDVNNISQRKDRLTEDNLIFASSFNIIKDNRDNIFDNNFSIFRFKLESAGNLLSSLAKISNSQINENDQHEIFGVAFSQYLKTEIDYVKHWDLGKKNVIAMRSYFGIAIPYGNSKSIPFSKSFFAGGPNDNRAWTAYNLGPGSSKSSNEFNEANLKINLSLEQRFNILGSLNGALFVDAGNIWNVYDIEEDDAKTFSGFSSLEDIAVGSGFGLRYDFGFFVLRTDIGFKTYDPSNDLGNRWFKTYNFAGAVYNIGINYPF